ncbi:sugar isomerase [Bacillus sp. 7504-2]|nr:sugar isomerase [Bacillus sp. 7504-2]
MNSEKKQANIELSCTEIGGLWGVYFQESMSSCFLTYFLHHLQDKEIIPLVKESLQISQTRLEKIKEIFLAENFPVPSAFSEGDLNLAAPPLFHDIFALSYVYMMNRLGMINFSFTASNNVRLDVLDFFTECIHTSTELFGRAVKMMLSKGIYDRPPKMNYPKEIEFVKKESFLSGIIGDKRPLNAIELSEIFFNIERNYFSVLIMLGFAQVVKDKNLKKHILKGKDVSEKQISLFNKLLMQEELLGTVTVSMEVTDSTLSPFSDKLIFSMINILNSVDISLISHAMSVTMRTDLTAQYSKIIAEVMLYAKETFDIVVERQWMEQPPLVTNRKMLIRNNNN